MNKPVDYDDTLNQHEQLNREREAFSRGIRHGERRERATIVSWLREEAEIQMVENNEYPEDTVEYWFAEFVERGEHVNEEKK